MRKKIAFIGVGNMAGAIISGILNTNGKCGITAKDIVLYDKYLDKANEYKRLGASVACSEKEAVCAADCVFLCVKPQNFPEILPSFADIDGVNEKLFVTIAAGIKTELVAKATNGASVVRVLPNTPMLIGMGVSAICRNHNVSDEDFSFVCDIFASSGSVMPIDEEQMNRIIGVTSSSPAYVFLFIKSMLDGAKAQGLVKCEDNPDGIPEELITQSICNMMIGSATLLRDSGKSADEQISAVASKGGTTERALCELEGYNFNEAIVSAMKKCTERANELGKQ